jgi:hypothetical protein
MNDTQARSLLTAQQLQSSDLYVYASQTPTDWWIGLLGPLAALKIKNYLFTLTPTAIELIEFDLANNFKQRTTIVLQTISKVAIKNSMLGDKLILLTTDNQKQEFTIYKIAGGFENQQANWQTISESLKKYL